MSVLSDKLKLLPTDPGVYVMLDKNGTVIYVGKAKNLKNRVRQYFFNTQKSEKVMAMVASVADFYYIITKTEIDALSLENNLIKKHKPRYNILLKDDKTYPYIKVDLKEDYPSFCLVRKIKNDGAKYFGPFMGGISVPAVLEMLNILYKVRPCDKKLHKDKIIKPCLNFHLKKCNAPCAGLIGEKEYSNCVYGSFDFLSGDVKEAKKILQDKMQEAVNSEDFELALKYRDFLKGLDKITVKRLTALNKFVDADVIFAISNGIYSVVNLLIVRSGRMLGSKNFSFETASLSDADLYREFITGYYKVGEQLPAEIIVGEDVAEARLIEKYFKSEFNKTARVVCPKMGVRKELLFMSEKNATEHLEIAVDRIKHKTDMTVRACEALKEKLNLLNYPKRMECYDISNISGVDKVGSMVVFIDGEKSADDYRRFKIKTVVGADDYKSHQEMMTRRLERLSDNDEKFPKPDLIIIDGGKGQLFAVKEIFDKFGVKDIDLIALAEKNEEIYTLSSPEPVRLDMSDYCLKMLIRIRDEAHRFAITYFRSLHGKNSLSSVLDKVTGLGKVKKKLLLERFKDLDGIIGASREELLGVRLIGEKQADQIIETLKEIKNNKNEV